MNAGYDWDDIDVDVWAGEHADYLSGQIIHKISQRRYNNVVMIIKLHTVNNKATYTNIKDTVLKIFNDEQDAK